MKITKRSLERRSVSVRYGLLIPDYWQLQRRLTPNRRRLHCSLHCSFHVTPYDLESLLLRQHPAGSLVSRPLVVANPWKRLYGTMLPTVISFQMLY